MIDIENIPSMPMSEIPEALKRSLVEQGFRLAGMTVTENEERYVSLLMLRHDISPTKARLMVQMTLAVLSLALEDLRE